MRRGLRSQTHDGRLRNSAQLVFVSVVGDRWSVVGGRWSVVGGRWSVVGGRSTVGGGWWAVGVSAFLSEGMGMGGAWAVAWAWARCVGHERSGLHGAHTARVRDEQQHLLLLLVKFITCQAHLAV